MIMAAILRTAWIPAVAVLVLTVASVQSQVTLTLHGSEGYMVKGGNFTLTCVLTGTPETELLTFYKDTPVTPSCVVFLSRPCQPGGSCSCERRSGASATYRLLLSSLSASQAGLWTCQVPGLPRERLPTFSSPPLPLPVFEVPPRQFPVPDLLVRPGETATFSWTLPDLSLVQTLWVFNASDTSRSLTVLPGSNAATLQGLGQARVTYLGNTRQSNMTFALNDVTAWDAGWYRCGRDSPDDVILGCGQRLVVLGPPTTPTLTSNSTTLQAGSDVILTCHSTSTSRPPDHGLTLTYVWIKDGVRMSRETGRHLVLKKVSRMESGRHYACAAQESRGLMSKTSTFVVLDVLETGDGATSSSVNCVTAVTSERSVTSQAGLSVGAGIGVGFAAGVVTSAVVAVASCLLLLRRRRSPRKDRADCGEQETS